MDFLFRDIYSSYNEEVIYFMELKRVGAIAIMVLLAIYVSTFLGPIGFMLGLWFMYMCFRKE